MSIQEVSEEIARRLLNIDVDTLQNAANASASWIGLIDVLDRFPIENQRLKKIISDTATELFKDINVSLALAISDNYGAAFVLARGCLEKTIYIIYFIDHPMAAFQWSMNDEDLHFSDIVEEMASPKYFEVATGSKVNTSTNINALFLDLKKIYRRYSESVHGKYSFMETKKGIEIVKGEYFDTVNMASDILRKISNVRQIV